MINDKSNWRFETEPSNQHNHNRLTATLSTAYEIKIYVPFQMLFSFRNKCKLLDCQF